MNTVIVKVLCLFVACESDAAKEQANSSLNRQLRIRIQNQRGGVLCQHCL